MDTDRAREMEKRRRDLERRLRMAPSRWLRRDRWSILRRLKLQCLWWALGCVASGILYIAARAAHLKGDAGEWVPNSAMGLGSTCLLAMVVWKVRIWLNAASE